MWRRFAALFILIGATLGLGMSVAHACDPTWHLDCIPQEQFLDCNWYWY